MGFFDVFALAVELYLNINFSVVPLSLNLRNSIFPVNNFLPPAEAKVFEAMLFLWAYFVFYHFSPHCQ